MPFFLSVSPSFLSHRRNVWNPFCNGGPSSSDGDAGNINDGTTQPDWRQRSVGGTGASLCARRLRTLWGFGWPSTTQGGTIPNRTGTRLRSMRRWLRKRPIPCRVQSIDMHNRRRPVLSVNQGRTRERRRGKWNLSPPKCWITLLYPLMELISQWFIPAYFPWPFNINID